MSDHDILMELLEAKNRLERQRKIELIVAAVLIVIFTVALILAWVKISATMREAKAALADEGYDPMYGARPLKRVVTRRLENPVSKMIIAGDLPEGKTLEVGYENGDFIYSTR